MAAARAERRLAAILAADVVGSSALMERDEDRTLARLKAHRKEFIEPLIAEYQGRIVKLMGDGALVEFASVVDAGRIHGRRATSQAKRICTSLPSSASNAWSGVRKPRHFRGVRLWLRMISCSSASLMASRSRGRSRRSRPFAFSTAPFCHDAYASQNQV